MLSLITYKRVVHYNQIAQCTNNLFFTIINENIMKILRNFQQNSFYEIKIEYLIKSSKFLLFILRSHFFMK